MEYRTFHVVPGIDSDGHVYFRVQHDGEVLSFSEMYERFELRLVSVVPINADANDWKGVAIFERKLES